ncbi:hypothetical protein BN1012_Phect2588 [Candidatus Phaeomarinobacter ectocarpi]|uniref:Uncharacterized protein n=1 Tax=Candidatus Phaeomarinibacter ectocarpi TaxID=1458461 RepID=X5MP25_9HYPH|nr:hypothetical protein [Candidatus Phaeomarinobacter ectocarpi]CDO60801.1 hypothetical protein BN1012_Phect2588 [Candidatus Phaeomarinobacter ectocarpi]
MKHALIEPRGAHQRIAQFVASEAERFAVAEPLAWEMVPDAVTDRHVRCNSQWGVLDADGAFTAADPQPT